MRQNCLGTVAVMLIAFVSLPVYAESESLDELVDIIEKKWAEIDSYTSDVKLEVNTGLGFLTLAVTSEGQMEYLRKDDQGLFRMEMEGNVASNIPGLRKGITQESLTVYDGEYRYNQTEVMGKTRVVRVKPKDMKLEQQGDGRQLLANLREKGEAKRLPDSTLNGTDVYGVEVVLTDELQEEQKEMMDTIRVYFAKNSGIMIRMAGLKGEEEVMKMDYTNLVLNPEIKPERFVYTPPPGVEVQDGPLRNFGHGPQ